MDAERPDHTPILRTRRFVLVPLGTDVIAARLAAEEVVLDLPALGGIRFDPDFAGDLLPVFPLWLAATPHPGTIAATWTIVEPATGRAIGAIGATSRPEHDGDDVEVGYGVAPTERGRGVATECLAEVSAALLDGRVWLGARPGRVTARTKPSNTASQVVLERCGFVRGGIEEDISQARTSDEPMFWWSLGD